VLRYCCCSSSPSSPPPAGSSTGWLPALAAGPALGDLVSVRAAQTAIRLRPSLAGTRPKDVATGDRGVTVGRLPSGGRELVQAGWEYVVLALMAPWTGKTAALATPAVLDAPGAVLATSNKSDLYLQTASIREQATGERVWVFDPQAVVHARRSWFWNPLSGRFGYPDADRLAGAFVLIVDDEHNREIWGPAARGLVAGMMLAARSAGGTLRDVHRLAL